MPIGRATSRPAFSLVELTMVLAIIGIAAAIAAPRWGQALGRYRCDAAARRLVTDLAMAQTLARSTSAPQTIIFNFTAENFRISGMTYFETATGAYTVHFSQPPYLADLSSTDYVSGTPVTYNGFGVLSAGGAVVISSGGFSRTVTIEAGSGAATIQ
jgi:prepilin-type N-terminal cleavage/methylation domain-containing protein